MFIFGTFCHSDELPGRHEIVWAKKSLELGGLKKRPSIEIWGHHMRKINMTKMFRPEFSSSGTLARSYFCMGFPPALQFSLELKVNP